MLFPRGEGRGTILLGLLRLLGLLGPGIGAFSDTRPGVARDLAQKTPPAAGRSGRMAAIVARKALSATPRMRLWRPPGGEVRAHG
jgi:hypothetical protein